MSWEAPREIARWSREAAKVIAYADTEKKNNALRRMAALLKKCCSEVVEANHRDLKAARKQGLNTKIIDRLTFDKKKVQSRIDSLLKIIALPDPIGQTFQFQRMANGLLVSRIRVPLGVKTIMGIC